MNLAAKWSAFCDELLVPPTQIEIDGAEYTCMTGLRNNIVKEGAQHLLVRQTFLTLETHPQLWPGLPEVAMCAHKHNALLVLSHPGTRKSTAIVYYLSLRMREGHSVLFSSASDPNTFFGWSATSGPQIYSANDAPFYEKEWWWFIHHAAHGYMNSFCKILLFSDPRPQNYQSLLHTHTYHQVAHFPLPSRTEMRVMGILEGFVSVTGAASAQQIGFVELDRRMDIAGCVPGSVFTTNFHSIEIEIHEVIHAAEYNNSAVFHSHVEVDGVNKSHVLFATNATAELGRADSTFLSDAIQQSYMQTWRERNPDTLVIFLRLQNTVTV